MGVPLLQNSIVSYHANGKVFLIMANHTPTYHTIKKNTIIGIGSSVKQNNINVIETCQVTPDDPLIAPVTYCSPDLAGLDFNQPLLKTDEEELAALSDVSPEFAKPLQEIINEYSSIFAADNSQIGLTHLIKMDIDTGDHPPIPMRPYQTSLTHCKWLEKEIDKLLRGGIIIPSHSPWSFPIVILKKKMEVSNLQLTIGHLMKSLHPIHIRCPESTFSGIKIVKIDIATSYLVLATFIGVWLYLQNYKSESVLVVSIFKT